MSTLPMHSRTPTIGLCIFLSILCAKYFHLNPAPELSKKKPLLLLIPIELRLQFYSHVFAETTPRTPHPYALLYVCRQIHAECYTIAVRHSRLSFRGINGFLTFWKQQTPVTQKHIKNLTLGLNTFEELYKTPCFLRAACSDLHLQSLTLVPRPDKPLRIPRRYTNEELEIMVINLSTYLSAVDNIDAIYIRNVRKENTEDLISLFCNAQFQARRRESGIGAWLFGFDAVNVNEGFSLGYRMVRTAAIKEVRQRWREQGRSSFYWEVEPSKLPVNVRWMLQRFPNDIYDAMSEQPRYRELWEDS